MTLSRYNEIFERECRQQYTAIDHYTADCGYDLDQGKLQQAARTLACPLKANPPNWQHGRVIYSTLRAYATTRPFPLLCLDIGTAKGFSALCILWALQDARGLQSDEIVSIDAVHPAELVRRNSVLELDGPKALIDYLEPWPECRHITFLGGGSKSWLLTNPSRIHFAFVDGKHDYAHVLDDSQAIAEHQQPDDIIIFDDIQITDVARAVAVLAGYDKQYLKAHKDRVYCIARRL